MTRGSFMFGSTDMKETYGLVVSEVHDLLLPQKRERKVTIPGRNGAYDYGAKTYGERMLTLDCNIVKPITRAQLREVSYALSKKDRIALWHEPEKYYLGALYDPTELERVGTTQKQFSLVFVCDPFAYGAIVSEPIGSGYNPIQYKGTAQTPTLIVLRNTGTTPIQNLKITAQYKR